MEKAKIMHCDDSGNPVITNSFSVQFNPRELTLDYTTGKYKKIAYDKEKTKGSVQNSEGIENSAAITRKNMEEVAMNITLFFNTFTKLYQEDYQDVRELLKEFKEFCNYNISDKEKLKKICFQWGAICIVGVLSSYQEKYTMFSDKGKPVRAEVSLTIEGRDTGYKSVKSKRIVTPTPIMTPFDKAMAKYKSPTRWKEFASQESNMLEILGKLWRQL